MKKGSTHFTISKTIIGLVLFFTGFIMATQLKTPKTPNDLNDLSEQELSQIIKEVSGEINRLRSDLTVYKLRLAKYQEQASDKKIILNQAAQNLDELNIIVGNTRVIGQGIEIRIEDNRAVLKSFDLIDLISELYSAGAEAVSIDDRRVTLKSHLDDNRDEVELKSSPLKRPYNVKAIGDSQILYQSMLIKGGIIDSFNSLKGVDVEMNKRAELILPPSEK